jgi:BirA family biotin operon repressor/biotin-[acetyl-CoA-carboxylase] ligase
MIGNTIVYLESVNSTNLYAKQLAKQGAEEGTIVVAEHQQQGRGRLGKIWESPKGTGLWTSLILRPCLQTQKVSLLTLLGGLAMCQTLEEMTGSNVGIKWPNDIVMNAKKVCGILTEAAIDTHGIQYVIVGVGLNVTMNTPIKNVPHATSLFLETGQVYQNDKLLEHFCITFEKLYRIFIAQESFEPFLKDYQARCVTLHKNVSILGEEPQIGYAQKITPLGELCVVQPNGQKIYIQSGEVSVRGLYGYV